MADGYSRAADGNIGICIGTSGPAGTDMITGLYAVWADSIPMRVRTDHLGTAQLRNSGFREVHALTELKSNVDTCIAEAGPLLERLGRRIGEQLAALAPATNADTKEAIHA